MLRVDTTAAVGDRDAIAKLIMDSAEPGGSRIEMDNDVSAD